MPEPERVREHMEAWRAHRGTAVDETVERLEALRSDGHRTYVFTNGTDYVPTELALLGLDRLFDGVLNSADFGSAPSPTCRRMPPAHRVIEADLGATWCTGRDGLVHASDGADNVRRSGGRAGGQRKRLRAPLRNGRAPRGEFRRRVRVARCTETVSVAPIGVAKPDPQALPRHTGDRSRPRARGGPR